ncbi:hypothetical protein CERSUDRAFT_118855 [Gelatoporia subvermispora B]|uniref:Uncharacterized protein n=1 Tax=Ceriporiopsis subvermispora (strain B) TaxID=914234 RepID=M2P9S9_CERS8|nr:hypothetical protein CERSUDRAFT_118855 [Gelatoporia subvermispora B]
MCGAHDCLCLIDFSSRCLANFGLQVGAGDVSALDAPSLRLLQTGSPLLAEDLATTPKCLFLRRPGHPAGPSCNPVPLLLRTDRFPEPGAMSLSHSLISMLFENGRPPSGVSTLEFAARVAMTWAYSGASTAPGRNIQVSGTGTGPSDIAPLPISIMQIRKLPQYLLLPARTRFR